MSTPIGERMLEAIEARGMSIRSFHLALHAKKIRGSSYASVHNYLKGRREPPFEFVSAAAEVLEIRLAWLASGEGAMTEGGRPKVETIKITVEIPASLLDKLGPIAR